MNVNTSGAVWGANFSHTTLCSEVSYTDYSELINVPVEQGATLTMGFTSVNYPFAWAVWIDFDDDFDFEPLEKVISESNPLGDYTFHKSFTVPLLAAVGVHRMRVMGDYNGTGIPQDPCGILDMGETEDYSFQVMLAAPTGITASANPICTGSSTTLTASGVIGTVHWFTGGCGTTEISTGNPITVSPTVTTTYYARNYQDASTISALCATKTITVNVPSFTTTRTVADLQATGTGIKWYAASSGGTPLATSTLLVNSTVYYASQTVNGVESLTRTPITATLEGAPCAPTGSANQTWWPGSTVSDLVATGSNLRWYMVPTGGTPLDPTTALISGNHYYGSQTVNCTESLTRLLVHVTAD